MTDPPPRSSFLRSPSTPPASPLRAPTPREPIPDVAFHHPLEGRDVTDGRLLLMHPSNAQSAATMRMPLVHGCEPSACPRAVRTPHPMPFLEPRPEDRAGFARSTRLALLMCTMLAAAVHMLLHIIQQPRRPLDRRFRVHMSSRTIGFFVLLRSFPFVRGFQWWSRSLAM